ncbi:MAG: hypothetical protein JO122_11760 [Acetobacteraceae bacterium]|nr:hypothetical protein [Acetobacteraceae bacterium]
MRVLVGAALGAVLLLAGCKDIGTFAGIASGSATGAATGNPGLGLAVGVAVGTATDFVSRYYSRVQAGSEQDVIAETAGRLPVGGEAQWRIRHFIPFGNEQGTLRVADEMDTAIAVCKEVVFSVTDGKLPPPYYTVDICRDPKGWEWASAEPAVPRWTTMKQ